MAPMKRTRHIEQHHYSGPRVALRKRIPNIHHPPTETPEQVRLFKPEERFKTRTGHVVFAYKRMPSGDYLFYAYNSDDIY